MPGRPPAMRASRRGERRVGDAVLVEDGLDVAGADGPQAEAGAARPDRREERLFGIGAQDQRHPGRRLLEGLEQGRLRVLVHAVGRLDDGDPCPALDRQQRQLADEVADPAGPSARAADDHLAAGSLGADPMQVRVPARGDQPARPARTARAVGDVVGRAQEPGRQVQRERRLADPGGTDEQDRVGRPSPDHRADRGERGRLSPGPGAMHADLVQADSVELAAVLRVVFRFGAGAAVRPPRPRRVRGGSGRVLLGVRRFGAGASAASVPLLPASADAAPVSAARCRLAGRAPLRRGGLALRVGRGRRRGGGRLARGSPLRRGRFGGIGRSGVGRGRPRLGSPTSDGADSVGREGSVTGLGFWPTWARSIASSSGGTSLHGSLDERRAWRGLARALVAPAVATIVAGRAVRSGVPAAPVRPLTSG